MKHLMLNDVGAIQSANEYISRDFHPQLIEGSQIRPVKCLTAVMISSKQMWVKFIELTDLGDVIHLFQGV
ncbi:hypothetical protein D3C71_1892140 [compost metagenome]